MVLTRTPKRSAACATVRSLSGTVHRLATLHAEPVMDEPHELGRHRVGRGKRNMQSKSALLANEEPARPGVPQLHEDPILKPDREFGIGRQENVNSDVCGRLPAYDFDAGPPHAFAALKPSALQAEMTPWVAGRKAVPLGILETLHRGVGK